MLNGSIKITEFAKARSALKFGLLFLDAKPGYVVLVPDYLCNVVWYPLLQLGLRIETYPLQDNLSPDWSALEDIQRRKSAWALLMVHYFGQPQNIEYFKRFCDRDNIKLIEDAAHGHGGKYQGQLLGTFGEIGITSPRKFLNLSSGGFLFARNDPAKQAYIGHEALHVYEENTIDILKSFIGRFTTINTKLKATRGIIRNWSDPLLFQESEKCDFLITPAASSRISRTDWECVARERRSVWQIWHDFCFANGLEPVFESISIESCPWMFPAYARDIAERNHWLIWGSKHGIPLSTWPALPSNVIAKDGAAYARWKRLLCFPLDVIPPRYKGF